MDGYLAQLAFTCSNLTKETLGQGLKGRHWRRSGVFTVNFEHISHIFLVFLLLTLNRQMLAGYPCIDLSFFFKNLLTENAFKNDNGLSL